MAGTNIILNSRSVSYLLLTLVLTGSTAVAQSQPPARTLPNGPIFIFHADEFWLNLHHFLHVLGRVHNQVTASPRDAVTNAAGDESQGLAKLTGEEQALWREAVSTYAATLSKKDLVFDEPLPEMANALARADNRSLAGVGIDPSIASVLERVAPIYRKAWWPNHRAANLEWQKETQKLVDLHGPRVLAFITRAYQMQWPSEGNVVHISAHNQVGAYSTRGNLLVVSSLDPSIKGNYALETIFHEGMHQWDSAVFAALREAARQQNRLVPRGLSHAMIFCTAGEAVRSVLPQHIPFAEKFGVWARGISPFRAAIEEVWRPYLDGRGTRDEALAELIKRTADEVRPPQKTSSPESR